MGMKGFFGLTSSLLPWTRIISLFSVIAGGILACEISDGDLDGHVFNRLGHASGDIRFALEWRGVTADGGLQAFAEVRALVVDQMGRAFVLDGLDESIYVFDPHGVHIRTFGGGGSGPSELRQPIGMTFDPTGRLWVADPGNGRYSVYDTAGFAVEHHSRALGGSLPWPGVFDSTGRLFDVGIAPTGEPDGFSKWIYRFPIGQVTTPTDSLLLPDEGGEMFEVPRTGWRGWLPFTSRVVYDLDPRGYLWFGETSDYELTKVNLKGDTLLVASLDRQATPVTDEERRTAMEELSSLGVSLPPGRLPDTKPHFESLHVTEDGGVWVYPYVLDHSLGTIIDMFSGDGIYVGSAVSDFSINFMAPPVTWGDFVYAITIDELNVPSLARFRMVESS